MQCHKHKMRQYWSIRFMTGVNLNDCVVAFEIPECNIVEFVQEYQRTMFHSMIGQPCHHHHLRRSSSSFSSSSSFMFDFNECAWALAWDDCAHTLVSIHSHKLVLSYVDPHTRYIFFSNHGRRRANGGDAHTHIRHTRTIPQVIKISKVNINRSLYWPDWFI